MGYSEEANRAYKRYKRQRKAKIGIALYTKSVRGIIDIGLKSAEINALRTLPIAPVPSIVSLLAIQAIKQGGELLSLVIDERVSDVEKQHRTAAYNASLAAISHIDSIQNTLIDNIKTSGITPNDLRAYSQLNDTKTHHEKRARELAPEEKDHWLEHAEKEISKQSGSNARDYIPSLKNYA